MYIRVVTHEQLPDDANLFKNFEESFARFGGEHESKFSTEDKVFMRETWNKKVAAFYKANGGHTKLLRIGNGSFVTALPNSEEDAVMEAVVMAWREKKVKELNDVADLVNTVSSKGRLAISDTL